MPTAGRSSFGALLRQVLANDRNRKLKDVADQVGLSSRNFYGRVTGRIQFTPDELNRVLRVVPDPRLGEWLLANTDLTCIRRVAPAAHSSNATLLDLALTSVEESMAALRAVLHMRPAGNIPTETAAEAEAHIAEAQRQLAALLTTLRVDPPCPVANNPGLTCVNSLRHPAD